MQIKKMGYMRFFSSFQHFMCQHHLSFRLVLGLVGIFFLMGTPLSPFYPFFLVKFKLSYDDVKSNSESFSLLFLFQKKNSKNSSECFDHDDKDLVDLLTMHLCSGAIVNFGIHTQWILVGNCIQLVICLRR